MSGYGPRALTFPVTPGTPAGMNQALMAAASVDPRLAQAALTIQRLARGRAGRVTVKAIRSAKSRVKRRRTGGTNRIAEPEGGNRNNVTSRDYMVGTSNSMATIARKTLYAGTIQPCFPPTDNDSLRNAPALSYFLTGVKLCLSYVSGGGTAPAHIHWAIVQLKAYNETVTTANLKTEMLTSHSSSTDRYVDFVDGGTWDKSQDCSPLNPRKFNIITHQRFLMSAGPEGNYPKNVLIDKWIPVNKKFEFENTSSTASVKPLVFMTWWEGLEPTNLPVILCNANTVGFVRKEA